MAAMGFYLRVGDATTCGGKILTGDETFSWYGVAAAREGDAVSCGQHPGMYRILGGIADTWDEGRRLAGTLDSFSSCPCSARFIQTIADGYIKGEPSVEKAHLQAIAQQQIEGKQQLEARDRQRVFAKYCLRGEGCNDAGEQQEPHTHFAAMAFYQAIPSAVPASDSDVPQYGQSAKKKNPVDAIPKPKKRSALYKWLFGDHEEFDYQQALAVATSEANADKAVEGASVFGLIVAMRLPQEPGQ